MGVVVWVVALFVVVLACSARWWTRHRHLYCVLFALFWALLLIPPLVLLWWAQPGRHTETSRARADLALRDAIDVFPAAWCREPSKHPEASVTDDPLMKDEALKRALEEAHVDPSSRWQDIYVDPMACPVQWRAARRSSTAPTPTATPPATPSTPPTSAPLAPDTAVDNMRKALAAWEASRRLPVNEAASSAGSRLDDEVMPDWTRAQTGSWPFWLLVLALALWAIRRVYVQGRLHGAAPLSLAPLEANAQEPEKAAARAFIAAAQEIKLVRPSAAPVSGVDDVIQSLTAVDQMLPGGQWFARALQAIWAFVRTEVRYDARIVGNPIGKDEVGIVVSVTEYPGGRSIVDRSIAGSDGEILGRLAAFDAGCAVLSASRKVPRYATWPQGTGEALRLYVAAMRESVLTPTVNSPAPANDRQKRLDQLRRARSIATGNGLVRHELALLEFQTGQLVRAAALLGMNAVQYPKFFESRYRFAVTLAMISQDVNVYWFQAPPELRRAVVNRVIDRARSEQTCKDILAAQPTLQSERKARQWLLEQAAAELRDVAERYRWYSLYPRRQTSNLYESSPTKDLRLISKAALHGSRLILEATTARDDPQQGHVDPLRGLEKQIEQIRMTGMEAALWQVTYNCACALARSYGIACDTSCASDKKWVGVLAAQLLVDAVHHTDFALPRWQDDVLDLIQNVDPDLQAIRDLEPFKTLVS